MSSLFDPTSLMKNADRVNCLVEMLRYLVDFQFDLESRLVFAELPTRSEVGIWKLAGISR